MADIADVEQALVGLIAGALYPNGAALPSAVGASCRVYRGWPSPKGLETDLRTGTLNITVTPGSAARTVTRYPRDWETQTVAPLTLGATVAGNQVSITGAAAAGLNVAIIADGTAWTYTVQPGDTLSGIAAALATRISARRPASSSGTAITVPNAAGLTARTGTYGTQIREVAREMRDLMVNLWCPSPALRDAAAAIIAPLLAATERLSLPDGSTARLLMRNSGQIDDGQQKEQLFRRWLTCEIEFPITQTQAATQIVAETLTIGGADPGAPVIATISQ